MLQGKNLILPLSAVFLDYSFNNFTSMIPNISSHISNSDFFSISHNQINGEIPTSICGAWSLQVLDLSHNNLSGQIPPCLGSSKWIRILNLGSNNFEGIIPETFYPETCKLQTLDFSGNRLVGKLPRSLASCTVLEVLNVGNNQLTGTFPSWLASMRQLRVLVLRSNKFHGAWGNKRTGCNFTTLQIIDISSNNFSGILSKECFSGWRAMMINVTEAEWNRKDQILRFGAGMVYYQQTVTVTIKGQDMELTKILTIFTAVDLSNNYFEGEIPTTIGKLTSLRIVNLSRNAFTKLIPTAIGNLTQLESLDLSRNKLIGKIPFQLARITSLSFLNLSFNQLKGKIPTGGQFNTFQPSSFEGNVGLCGFPLENICDSPPHSPNSRDEDSSDSKYEFDWVLFAVTFSGFVVGAAMVMGPQYFWKEGRKWANEHINRLLRIS